MQPVCPVLRYIRDGGLHSCSTRIAALQSLSYSRSHQILDTILLLVTAVIGVVLRVDVGLSEKLRLELQ
ncbi:MAG: hypothetical protein EAZ34_06930 [Polaromonas sp.]|nr:MAG: hypothetical protein EAZ34_06930 [Polaromonas sp.]